MKDVIAAVPVGSGRTLQWWFQLSSVDGQQCGRTLPVWLVDRPVKTQVCWRLENNKTARERSWKELNILVSGITAYHL